MQVLIAAPFLLLAAILFAFLSAFTSLRRYAIPASAGVLGFVAGGIAGWMTAATFYRPAVAHGPHAHAAAPYGFHWLLFAFAAGGAIMAAVSVLATKWILRAAPATAVRGIAFCGALGSYFLLVMMATVPINYVLKASDNVSWVFTDFEFVVAAVMSVLGALVISREPEGYRMPRRVKSAGKTA